MDTTAMNQSVFLSIALTGFAVALAHAAIPTHWLPFVLAGRGQKWSRPKTLAVVAMCGAGHVVFTAVLGALLVWFGIETSGWLGRFFPWIAGGALILFGCYYLWRHFSGSGHVHLFGGDHGFAHSHDGHDQSKHDHSKHDHSKHDHSAHGHAHHSVAEISRQQVPAHRSDSAVITSLFTLLTFSPCEGFLPVYVSGISYGWPGFAALSLVLAFATIAAMVIFTWVTMSGVDKLRLNRLEQYETAFVGAAVLLLGVSIIYLEG
jgi:nickel/cobalt transporter (NicO) family protein